MNEHRNDGTRMSGTGLAGSGARPGSSLPSHSGPAPVPTLHRTPILNEEPIELVEDLMEELPAASTPSIGIGGVSPMKSKIKQFNVEAARKEQTFRRPTSMNGQGATRVKSFHAKYSDQGVEHLDEMINAWIDAHDDVEVKFVTSTVHVFEGKIREPALVMNLWY